ATLSSARCFGSVAEADVVRPLRARGFSCNDTPSCDLWIGGGGYRVHLVTTGDGVSGYSVEARFDPVIRPRRRALDLLSWLAALPFGHDPGTAAAARGWTLQQLRAHTYAVATINGYGYEVEGRGDQAGSSLPQCGLGSVCTVPLRGYFSLAVEAKPG